MQSSRMMEEPAALRSLVIAGPEVSHLVTHYEKVAGTKDITISSMHHEQSESAQVAVFERVEKLFKVIKEMGNLFDEESADLFVLDTKDIADPANSRLVATHHYRGKDQFQSFIEGLKKAEQTLFYQPIKKNKITFFKQEEISSAASSKKKTLKEDCRLFSQLFISCQSRQCDLHELFQHENQSAPASLSDSGKLHTCQKL